MADKPEVCGFCHSDQPRETIYVGQIEYGSRCVRCGATSTKSARELRIAAKGVTPGGFDSTPVGIVSKMLKDPYKFFTGRKQQPPKSDN